MKTTSIIVSISSFFLTACAISPERIAKQSDLEVCRSYGIYRSGIGFGSMAETYRSEIIQRKLLTDDELAAADKREIRIGDKKCAMYAAWGRPDRENRTVRQGGTFTQHVYNAGYRYIRPTYIYTDDTKVTAFQD